MSTEEPLWCDWCSPERHPDPRIATRRGVEVSIEGRSRKLDLCAMHDRQLDPLRELVAGRRPQDAWELHDRDLFLTFLDELRTTQTSLARETGIPPETIRHLVTGRKRVSGHLATKIAAHLGLEVEDLFR